MKNNSAGFSSSEMRRSVSLTSNPKYFENKALRRTSETEYLNVLEEIEESPENIEVSILLPQSEGKKPKISKDKNKLEILSTEDSYFCESELKNDNQTEYYVGLFNTKNKYRLVEKSGKENVVLRRIPYRSWHFMKDIITTLIECDWKCTLSLFLSSYCLSWLLFAGCCYFVSYKHGDFNSDKQSHEPCVHGVYNFLSMLIYSIETQTTLGFGEKFPTEECPETIALFILQIICSIAIEGAMISLIYVKTAKPVRQLAKLKFSDKAVICYRDDKLCLIFRVCDPLEKQSIGTKIRAYLIVEQPTADGEILNSHVELKLEGKGEQIITWPELLCHIIDENSPLGHLTSAKGFNSAKFELYVSIVGVSPTTAQITESRSSYVPREIFWGQSFVNIIHYDDINEHYVVDYSNFNTTISVDMKN